MKNFLVMGFVLSLSLMGCGKSEIGESCATSGQTDDCVDGAVCTSVSGKNVCKKSCTQQSDCASGESCNGVSGSSAKSCQ
ncbi:MAG: hypothetical protein JNL01_02170 [Bdellovibrionales bacterium]|nr:hypothetical protein [Bdellovibrionales bacterium]